ncbi:septal ring lytic transglycosylase RlpA family protein [Halomonas sp. HP20-15]|uniref:septal ring lytic transglycosylase RlpA family protein n=1 Tax=Halomonas sp. HP20-15 TaxID=3085901 RepID=UPI0029818C86|nr:septal ring lytic transglycosylase RlpA family protein [Halomonas sp. HP20-15]MDW5376644.1 septal ring lytic transglycosylase RlpA family protein [Halomonas sp. HP20-15]
MRWGWLLLLGSCLVLAGCAGGGGSRPDANSGRYALAHDAYPGEPPDVSQVPDAVPRVEPRAASGNRSTYQVWGTTYHVMDDASGYEAEGKASWYGKKFQGYDTASGEPYDMYKMSAAHRSLPLPTYARVSNLDNGHTVIVKVNDRGPFHGNRLIDLSYAAAARLGILRNGTGHVRVEAIDPVAWQAEHRQDGAGKALASSETPPGNKPMERSGRAEPKAPDATARAVGEVAKAMPANAASQPTAEQTLGSASPLTYLQVAALSSASSAERLKARLQQQLARPVRIASDDRLYRVQVGPVTGRPALEALRSELREAGYAQAFSVSASR